MKTEKRIEFLDVAKGIAIIMVLLGHCECPDLLHRFIFSFHMPLFFLISGYFAKPKNLMSLMASRAKHLLVPYLITGMAGMTVSGLMVWHAAGSAWKQDVMVWAWAIVYGSGKSVEAPFRIVEIGAIWFLLAVFFASIIFQVCSKSRYRAVWVGVVAWTGYATMNILRLPFSMQCGMFAVLYFYVGSLSREKQLFERMDKKTSMAATALAVIVWAIYLYSGGGDVNLVSLKFGKGLIDIPVGICASFVIIQLSRVVTAHLNWIKKVLLWGGRNTLKILCLHLLELKLIPWDSILQNFEIRNGGITFLLIFVLRLLWAGIGVLILNGVLTAGKRLLLVIRKQEIVSAAYELPVGKNRMAWIDIAKGIAILLMIYTHLGIDENLRQVVFSFHMPIFLVLSGYLYRKESIKSAIWKKGKGLLIPYACVEVGAVLLGVFQAWVKYDIPLAELGGVAMDYIKAAFLGISFSSTIFTDVYSVGPVWFIICLFLAQIFYTIIVNITGEKEGIRLILVLAVTVLGWAIGKYIAYLPWSMDVSMVSVFFLYVGNLLKKYDIIGTIKEKSYLLLVVMIWIAVIPFGRMSLASRVYPMFPACLIGGVAGSVVIMLICQKLEENCQLRTILSFFGRYSMLVLGIHTLEINYTNWVGILPGVSYQIIFLLRMIFNISCICILLSIKFTYSYWRKAQERL